MKARIIEKGEIPQGYVYPGDGMTEVDLHRDAEDAAEEAAWQAYIDTPDDDDAGDVGDVGDDDNGWGDGPERSVRFEGVTHDWDALTDDEKDALG